MIAQGSDGRHHFPAAVAGEIYRELNHRFGTAIDIQVATTADDEEKEVADQEAAANGESTDAQQLDNDCNSASSRTSWLNEPRPRYSGK